MSLRKGNSTLLLKVHQKGDRNFKVPILHLGFINVATARYSAKS